ncbi:peroxiredoxin [Shewanella colwelliana]|nr:peroxiredoxin [Shewanella colwelliana]
MHNAVHLEILPMTFNLTLNWQPHAGQQSPRDHTISFGSGQMINGSAASTYQGCATKVNPEESLLAAISACHMMSVLTIADKKRLTITGYTDQATATLGKNSGNRLAINHIILRPKIEFSDESELDLLGLQKLHHLAHSNCFIANSLSSEVKVTIEA